MRVQNPYGCEQLFHVRCERFLPLIFWRIFLPSNQQRVAFILHWLLLSTYRAAQWKLIKTLTTDVQES
jgi:hypothetical protein